MARVFKLLAFSCLTLLGALSWASSINLADSGFQIDEQAVWVDAPGTDRFSFYGSFTVGDPVVTGTVTERRARDFALTPRVLRTNRLAYGIELEFPLGLQFQFSSNLSPYLSWNEGTVDAGVPTAPSRWIMVSFQDGQPPVVLLFDQPVQMVVQGQSGGWRLQTIEPFSGWVRLILPFGRERIGSSVSALGRAVEKTREVVRHITREAPTLESVDIQSDEQSVTAIWTFDKPGALVPTPLLLARAGSYMLEPLVGVGKTVAELPEGPLAFVTEKRLVVKFPSKRVPIGRPLTVSPEPREWMFPAGLRFTTAESFQTAMINLACDRPRSQFASLESHVEHRLSGKAWPEEPESAAMDLLTARTFDIVTGQSAVADRLASAVTTHLDPLTWKLTTSTPASDALAIVGLGLSYRDSDRLTACLLQASWAAQTGLRLYRTRRGFEASPVDPVPLFSLRSALFGFAGEGSPHDPFVTALQSPVRVVSRQEVWARKVEGGYVVQWNAIDEPDLHLQSAYPIEVEARKNVQSINPTFQLGRAVLRIKPTEPGMSEVVIRFPAWAKPLPPTPAVPTYS